MISKAIVLNEESVVECGLTTRGAPFINSKCLSVILGVTLESIFHKFLVLLRAIVLQLGSLLKSIASLVRNAPHDGRPK